MSASCGRNSEQKGVAAVKIFERERKNILGTAIGDVCERVLRTKQRTKRSSRGRQARHGSAESSVTAIGDVFT